MDIEGRQQHRIPHRAAILTTAADHTLLPGLRELGDPPITDPIRGYLSQILHGDSWAAASASNTAVASS